MSRSMFYIMTNLKFIGQKMTANRQCPKTMFVLKNWYMWLSTNAASSPLEIVKQKSTKELSKRYVDYKRVAASGGAGGNGCMSFMHLPMKEFAGPDGGNGGNGGHVIFKASESVRDLSHVPSIVQGEDGARGRSSHCHGKNAQHSTIQVPIGTLVKDDQDVLLRDLAKKDDYIVAARGGAGGHGNHFFLSNEHRAPTVYEEGAAGEQKTIQLELRVMADIGLVGFPNAGKSTLLRAVSRARPKVAAYPFTTLNPHVGIVEYDDREQLAVADIPGLIKGAHLNYGLGFSFLRHIERCKCLIYVLDLAADEPWTQLSELQYELEQYQAGLSLRPNAIVANKIDLPFAQENLVKLKEKLRGVPIFPISAMKKVKTAELMVHLRRLCEESDKQSELFPRP